MQMLLKRWWSMSVKCDYTSSIISLSSHHTPTIGRYDSMNLLWIKLIRSRVVDDLRSFMVENEWYVLWLTRRYHDKSTRMVLNDDVLYTFEVPFIEWSSIKMRNFLHSNECLMLIIHKTSASFCRSVPLPILIDILSHNQET